MSSRLPWPSPWLWDSIWGWWQYFSRPTIIYRLGSGIARAIPGELLVKSSWHLWESLEHFHDGAGESGPESRPSVCLHSLPSIGITPCGLLSPSCPSSNPQTHYSFKLCRAEGLLQGKERRKWPSYLISLNTPLSPRCHMWSAEENWLWLRPILWKTLHFRNRPPPPWMYFESTWDFGATIPSSVKWIVLCAFDHKYFFGVVSFLAYEHALVLAINSVSSLLFPHSLCSSVFFFLGGGGSFSRDVHCHCFTYAAFAARIAALF